MTPLFKDMLNQNNISLTCFVAHSFFSPELKEKDLFHVCEKFAMVNAVSISYAFTFIINSVLECLIS